MSLEVISMGCRLNLAEGEALRRSHAGRDAVIVNSCAVTAEAERQARQAVRRAARAGRTVLATGCAVRLDPARWAAMPEVSAVLAPQPGIRPAVSGADHARAFIEVQNGCDHDCTFCVTRIARGPSRSLAPAAIVEAVRVAVASGQHEVVLTGVDLTGYSGGLGALVRHILDAVPDLPRLRLSSLDPADITGDLLACLVDEPRLMPHVHLSLQAGDDMVLTRMKRRHRRRTVIALVETLKRLRPEIAIGADMIAGFPTESAAMAQNSLSILEDADVVLAHVFPYSPRPGTAAARMPQLAPTLVRERAARLRFRAAERKAAWLAGQIGTVQPVLIERDGISGHTPAFATVTTPRQTPGTIAAIRITMSDGARLAGQPA